MGRQCRQRFFLSGGNYWYEDTCQVVGSMSLSATFTMWLDVYATCMSKKVFYP